MCYIANGQFELPTTLIAGRLAPRGMKAKPRPGEDKGAGRRDTRSARAPVAREREAGDDLLGQMLSELTW